MRGFELSAIVSVRADKVGVAELANRRRSILFRGLDIHHGFHLLSMRAHHVYADLLGAGRTLNEVYNFRTGRSIMTTFEDQHSASFQLQCIDFAFWS